MNKQTIELLRDEGKKKADYEAYLEHYGCKLEKLTRHNVLISTEDPINFYWLGANANNWLINKLMKNQK